MVLVLRIKWVGYFLLLGSILLIYDMVKNNNFSDIPLVVITTILGLAFTYFINIKKTNLNEKPSVFGLILILIALGGSYTTLHQGIRETTDYIFMLVFALSLILGVGAILNGLKAK